MLFQDDPYPWPDTGEPGVGVEIYEYRVRSTSTWIARKIVQIPLRYAAFSQQLQVELESTASGWLTILFFWRDQGQGLGAIGPGHPGTEYLGIPCPVELKPPYFFSHHPRCQQQVS